MAAGQSKAHGAALTSTPRFCHRICYVALALHFTANSFKTGSILRLDAPMYE
jgi:hypothetical protein